MKSKSNTLPTDQIDRAIGERVCHRRLELGKSTAELSVELGCEPSAVLDYEAGRRRLSARSIYLLTRVLDVDANYFFSNLVDGA